MTPPVDDGPGVADAIPHDVVRDKRGQACTNCRQAKLRCIRRQGQIRCVRCEKRSEECFFTPRTYDSQWHEQIASDIHHGLRHLARLTDHVKALGSSLGGEGSSEMLESYRPPPSRANQSRHRAERSESPVRPSHRRETRSHPDHSIELPAQPDTPHYPPSLTALPDFGLGEIWEHEGDTGDEIAIAPLDSISLTSPTHLRRPYLGCNDPRPNVISKQLVTAAEADEMFAWFNQHMGPSLFGYDPLQIPYHPGSGPFISPLILAVICAIASERDPKYPPDLRVKLYHEALELISSSPTGSFMNTVDLETVRLQPEEWDPELGIGPEEVVAVSYLALFIDDRVRGPNIARLSRRWVEGLINWTRSPDQRATLSESMGVLPPPRTISQDDINRFWLLSFISRRFSDFQSRYPNSFMPTSDDYCAKLASSNHRLPGDAALIHCVQLITALGSWYEAWRETDAVLHRFELSRKANLAFDRIYFQIESVTLSEPSNPLLQPLYFFAKAITHASLARVCDPRKEDEKALKRPNWAAGVDASIEMLRVCSELPEANLVNLPITVYTMLDQVVEIILEGAKTANTFWSLTVTGYMERIADVLDHSPLPDRHISRATARMLHRAKHLLGRGWDQIFA